MVCPSHAIQVMGEYKTVNEAFKIAAQDGDFYSISGGGVTVSGGEPLLQWEFVRDFFKKCKEAGLHTALDTSAHCPWERMEQVLKYTDLILFDIKHTDPVKHKQETGITNELILENLGKASDATKKRIWLRIPLLPGFNDSESNMQETAEIASRTGPEKVCLLPYHDWGKGKYSSLGKRYGYNGAHGMLGPDGDLARKFRSVLESHGLEVTVGK
jgi:pyruvate formate lyase activating enzyme